MAYIAVHDLCELSPEFFQHMFLLHHTASHDDALRRERYRQIHQSQREIMRFEVPPGMFGPERGCGLLPPSLHGRTAGEPFQAVTVIRTDAGERVASPVMWDMKMTHFRMNESMNNPAVDQGASPDARADRHVDRVLQALGCAPPSLGQNRAVHIGIKRHGHIECPFDGAAKVEVLPSNF